MNFNPPTRRYKGHCPKNHIVRATLSEDQLKTTLVNCETCGVYVLPVWDEVIDPTARYRHPEGVYNVGVDTAKPGTDETITQGLYESMQARLRRRQEFALRRIGLGPKK